LRKAAAWQAARAAAGLSRKAHGARLVALLTLRRALRQWARSVAAARGPPLAAALSPSRLLVAAWGGGEAPSAGWQRGAALRVMLVLRRWSAHACALRRRQATEEEAAIRYVRYVQDLLWHAVAHYLLGWSRNARARARDMERARFARLRGDRRAVARVWRRWRMHGSTRVRACAFRRAAGLQATGGALQLWRVWTRAAATLQEASRLGDGLGRTRRRRRGLRRWRAAAAGERQSALCRVRRLRLGLRMWRERAGARAAVRATLAAGAARGAIAWRPRALAASWRRWTALRRPPRAARFVVAAAATLVPPALRGGWMRWRARAVERALVLRQRSSCRSMLLARGWWGLLVHLNGCRAGSAIVAAAPAVHRRRLLRHAFSRLLEVRLSHAGVAQVAAYP